MPAICLEALRRVVREPALDAAVDRDAVVIVEDDELSEPQGASQRASLVRHSFHEATVTHEDIRVVGDDLESGAVELLSASSFSAIAIPTALPDTLPEGTRGGLNPRRETVFRMAGCL